MEITMPCGKSAALSRPRGLGERHGAQRGRADALLGRAAPGASAVEVFERLIDIIYILYIISRIIYIPV